MNSHLSRGGPIVIVPGHHCETEKENIFESSVGTDDIF